MSDLKRQAIEEYKRNATARKERVQMRDAVLAVHPWRGKLALFGIPLDHSNPRLNGTEITTSSVVNHNAIEVETLNTIYVIQNWAKPYGT